MVKIHKAKIPDNKGFYLVTKAQFRKRKIYYIYWLIVIDSTRCKLHQRKTLGHELAHLFLDHLDQFDRDIRDIEREAQKMSWTFYKAYISGLLEDNT